MITEVSFRNFKSIRSAVISLRPLTVLVGPNSSGKTSILEGLNHLAQVSQRWRGDHTTPYLDLQSLYQQGGAGPLEISAVNGSGGLRFQAGPNTRDQLDTNEQKKLSWEQTLDAHDGNGHWLDAVLLPAVLQTFKSTQFLRLDAHQLKRASYIPHREPRMSSHGYGLASRLAYMALNQPQEFDALQSYLSQIVPQFRRIRFDRTMVRKSEVRVFSIDGDMIHSPARREYIGDSLLFDMTGGDGISAKQMSEGFLLVLGLMAVLFGPTPPTLILLDDIDKGLHPRAQSTLIDLLRTVLSKRPELQLVATTHSPYLLDNLAPEEIICSTVTQGGCATLAPITKHPDFGRWKNEMRPGEFWSMAGEKWVAEL